MSFKWVCPHCQHAQVVVDEKFRTHSGGIGISDLAEGVLAYELSAIGCANSECSQITIRLAIGKDTGRDSGWHVAQRGALIRRQIFPQSEAKPQPEFIPQAIREDYYEACLIKELSPKASATLARRCLQGMIRNFCGISMPRLIEEIRALQRAIDDGTADRAITAETVAAIDHVRKIGNVGAHMERDVGTIVEVDPDEAQALIELIEMLFDEWYGAREERRRRLARIEGISAAKAGSPGGMEHGGEGGGSSDNSLRN